MNNPRQNLQLLAELHRRAGGTPPGLDGSSRSNSSSTCSGGGGGTLNKTDRKNCPTQLFPYILHGLLEDMEQGGQTGIISWARDGNSFCIHNPKVFAETVLPTYFSSLGAFAKFRSQLDDWGFDNVDGGSFFHPCFQKGKPTMCRFMRCGRTEEEEVQQPQKAVQAPSVPAQTAATNKFQTQGHSPATNLTLDAAILQQLQTQQQQQQQQFSALQLKALMNSAVGVGSSQGNTSALASLLLSQMLGRHQMQRQQQQCQVQPVAPSSSVQTLARQRTVEPTTSPSSSAVVTSVATTTTSSGVQASQQAPVTPAKSTIMAKAETPKSSASAKRAAFLNKRCRSAGKSVYRNPNKKQKTESSTSCLSSNISNSTSSSTTTPARSGASPAAVRDPHSFIVNDDFKGDDVPDLLFPWKLHDMLDDAEHNDDIKNNVVSWKSDGVSFEIHDDDRFVKEVMPRYFEEKDREAFTQVLSSWGFVRFTSGAQEGAFIHRLLVKGKRSLCKQMRIKGKAVSELMKQHGQFLGRLHALLLHAERQEKTSVVSWSADGKRFTIHDSTTFMNSLFTEYFDSMTFGSLEQKLKRWGFLRNPANMQKLDKDSTVENVTYWHPRFVKDKEPSLEWVKPSLKIHSVIRPEHNFLVRLRVMLNDASRDGNESVVTWMPHGKAFMIHDRNYFSNSIMPNYFKSKFTSFRQALRNHGFAQMGGNSWDEGAYYHKLFLRDEPLLCQGLTHEQMKKAMPEWIPTADEPSFYPEQEQDPSLLEAANSIVSLKSLLKK